MQVIVQDLLTRYEKQGRGKTIVLLHGWADRLETFNSILPDLVDHFTVITLDLPGFGQSQAPKTAWKLDDYAKFIAEFLKKVSVKEDVYAIVAHSNGCAVAIRGTSLGLLKPQKLVLLAASGVRDTAKLRRLITMAIAKTGKVATFWLPTATKQKLQKKLYGTIGSDMLVKPELQETFKQTVRQDIQPDAANIQLPTLLMYGDQDTATPLKRVGVRLNKLIPQSDLKVIAGAEHFIHHTNPQQVDAYILEFLQ